METSPSDRLANLFTAGSLPSKPTSAEAHIIDQDAAKMAGSTKSSWKIPEQAEYPRQVHGERPKPASGTDLLTSSDDDDYVAAFATKPKMQAAKSKWRERPQSKQISEADAHGNLPLFHNPILPQHDGKGNAVTGHFCVFTLVAKLPYKYMTDVDGRVSRHFFANDKFFQRQWDL